MAEKLIEGENLLSARWRRFESQIIVGFAISALMVVPCWWHRRIEAGDLASHVYNAWLAQLVEKGQAPGLYFATQWNNILFDVLLLRTANLFGLAAAQKIVVSACVLIFFWGVFAFIRTVTERPPWFLVPCIAMLAYGYSFSMGFMNYYLSLGLACFGLAIVWRARRFEWIAAIPFAALTLLAHPIGFLWLVGTLAYVKVREKLAGWRKLAMPVAAASVFAVVYWYTSHRPSLFADWDRGPLYSYNGADQLALYGKRYFFLAGAAFLFGLICVAWDFYERRREGSSWKPFDLPFELYAVTFCGTALLPENLRPSIYGGWIGVIGSRLTTVSAILGLCFLGFLKPRRWHFAGFGVCAIVFFAFLYQDTGWLNRLEANAEKLVSNLPPGTRVIVTVRAPVDSRISFIGHSVERACIGHCFSYANYEPASQEFRVRVRKGSPVVTSSTDDAEDMASGEYEVDDTDLPLKQIYQCDPYDLTKLCIRDLQAGEVNGRLGFKSLGRRNCQRQEGTTLGLHRICGKFLSTKPSDSHASGRGGLTVSRMGAILVAALGAALVARPLPSENGWVSLFNGKDLTGWKNNGAEKWVVEQGTILCESAANKYGYLTTEKTYRDFHLRLKFKSEAAGNSGVFFHSRITGLNPDHGPDIEGMQVEVDPSVGKHTGGLYESGGRGWVKMPTPEGEQALKPGEWNDFEVSVQGNHIVTRLNGVKIVDFIDDAPKFTDGVIGLQIHTGGGVRMRWKDIFIQEK